MDKIEGYFDTFKALIITYGLRIILAIVVLIIGLWIIRRLIKIISRKMVQREVDESLRPFLVSLISALLKVMLIISVMSMIGIQMTSFIAVLGAAGLAVGLALQGSLANFAGGVLILLLKPFKVGDFIDTGSYSGTVREIQIFYTYITTTSNQEVIIPNGSLSNNAVLNYSYHDTRRLDMSFSIGYTEDIDKAKRILTDIMVNEPLVLTDPEVNIFVEDLSEHAIKIHVRAWLISSDYWTIHNDLSERVKKAFDVEGVRIPFPLRNIHIVKED